MLRSFLSFWTKRKNEELIGIVLNYCEHKKVSEYYKQVHDQEDAVYT
jgi:hypothetical protein